MSAGDRDMLAALLAKHDHWNIDNDADMTPRCKCGHPVMVDGRIAHRAHVADVLLASDWLAGVKAEAWDEGQRAGFRFYREHVPFAERDRNPYRTTENTEPTNHR